MPTFKVRWEIEIDADNAEEAACKALEIQRDPTSIGTVFDVTQRVDVVWTGPEEG